MAAKILSIRAGGFYYPSAEGGACIFWNLGGTGVLSVASHEGLHQFLANRMDNPLPMWLEEGLCTIAEGYYIRSGRVFFTPERNDSRFGSLRAAAVNDRWIPLAKLLRMDAGDAVGNPRMPAVEYYAQLWALVQFLQSRPDLHKKLRSLLTDAEAGAFPKALRMRPADFARLRRAGRLYNRTMGPKLFAHYISDDLDRFQQDFRQYAHRLARLDDPPE